MVKCAVCEQTIVEGKEQALYCEGTCMQWFHRYCAGIPSSLFASLSTSSSPFKCYACCQQSHAQEIATLRDTVATLKDEISVLRNDINNIKAVGLSNVSAGVNTIREGDRVSSVGVIAVGAARGARRGRNGRGGM